MEVHVMSLQLFLDVIFVVLSVFGLISLLWCIFGTMLLPITHKENVVVILPINKKNSHLQKTVLGLDWLRKSIFPGMTIIIVHKDLDEQLINSTRIITNSKPGINMCSIDELDTLVKSISE